MAFPILVDEPLAQWVLDMLGEAYELHYWQDADPAVWQEIVGSFIYGHPQLGGDFMDRLPRLEVISNFGVGVDHIDLDAARQRGIPVGNTPHMLDGATADMAFALVMAAARNMIVGDRYARSSEFTRFDPNILLGREVHSSTMGIFGLGNIGFQLARRCQGFDIEVIYHNRNRNARAESELGAVYVSSDELLQRADFVVLTVPLTPETRHMIGRREYASGKDLLRLEPGGDHVLFRRLSHRPDIAVFVDDGVADHQDTVVADPLDQVQHAGAGAFVAVAVQAGAQFRRIDVEMAVDEGR